MHCNAAGTSENTMATRACITILAMTLLCSLSTASAEEGRYVFTSLVGQDVIISAKDAKPKAYSVEIGDVTKTTEACDEHVFRVCLVEDYLAVAMPKDPPAPGMVWSVSGAEFRVLSDVGEIKWLGRSIDGVFAVSVERHFGSKVRRFKLLFSYSGGLLAFQEAPGMPFVAGDLPSWGHSKDQ